MNLDAIKHKRTEIFDRLANEEKQHGGYNNWFSETEVFRRSIKGCYKSFLNISYKVVPHIMASGDLLDHHILSYIAPLEFKGIGWNRKWTTPANHIGKLSEFFVSRGKRFIYVPLPNKAVIYPELLSLNDNNLFWNAPQWRYFLYQVLKQSPGIEIIDGFQILKEYSKDYPVFAKGHHISSFGADVLARELGKYLTSSESISVNNYGIKRKIVNVKYYDWDYVTRNHLYFEDLIVHYDSGGRPFFGACSESSKIGLIGDCNIQHYQMHAAGFGTSLSYYIESPIDEVGRYLPYDYSCNISGDIIKRLLDKEVIVYVAFASASFVRSRVFSYKRLGLPIPWSTLDIGSL